MKKIVKRVRAITRTPETSKMDEKLSILNNSGGHNYTLGTELQPLNKMSRIPLYTTFNLVSSFFPYGSHQAADFSLTQWIMKKY